jgi:hypothetical protein
MYLKANINRSIDKESIRTILVGFWVGDTVGTPVGESLKDKEEEDCQKTKFIASYR